MKGIFFIRKKGVITGPFAEGRLREWLASGRLSAGDEVSEDKLTWKAADRFLGGSFPSVPPIPPFPPSPSVHSAQSPSSCESNSFGVQEDVSQWSSWDPAVSEESVVQDAVLVPEDHRTHLWIFCHLICGMVSWNAHARALERRCSATAWMASGYVLIVSFASLGIFCRVYPALRGYLWGSAGVSGALVTATVFAFLAVGIATRLRQYRGNRRVVTSAAMTLLSLFATAFGSVLALLHGVMHSQPWGRIVALLALALVPAFLSTGSRQIFLGLVHSSDAGIRRRGALRVWAFWMILNFLELVACSLFALGCL